LPKLLKKEKNNLKENGFWFCINYFLFYAFFMIVPFEMLSGKPTQEKTKSKRNENEIKWISGLRYKGIILKKLITSAYP